MHPASRSAPRVRVTAAALVLGFHGLVVALLVIEGRLRPQDAPKPRDLEGIWINLPALEPPPALADKVELARPTQQRSAAVSRAVVLPQIPPTAITLAPAGDSATPSPAPGVDWQEEADKLREGYGKDDKPATFSPPPATMRKPCTTPESSFKWIAQTKTTGSAWLTPGWEEPDPDKHYFDDMKKGKTQNSSVPDPNVCD
jgi:hypothetical protein